MAVNEFLTLLTNDTEGVSVTITFKETKAVQSEEQIMSLFVFVIQVEIQILCTQKVIAMVIGKHNSYNCVRIFTHSMACNSKERASNF